MGQNARPCAVTADLHEVAELQHDTRVGLSWYDLICPFCYVGQQRTRILTRAGLNIVELPFQAHSDIPVEGIPAGTRTGPMYEILAAEAQAAGLPLNWPARLPNTRLALSAAEWIRRHSQRQFSRFRRRLFEAHFVLGEDLGDPAIIDRHLAELPIDVEPFWAAVADSTAERAVREAEAAGRSFGVHGTPAWLVAGQLIEGLRPASEFERLAEQQQDAGL